MLNILTCGFLCWSTTNIWVILSDVSGCRVHKPSETFTWETKPFQSVQANETVLWLVAL